MSTQTTPTPAATKKEAPVKGKLNLKYMRDKDRELVRGIFRFHEVPGGRMEFPFRKYKEDSVETYKLDDGQIYSIPLGVAKHLNKNCSYPIHSYVMDERGQNAMKVSQRVRRCSFQSLEFIDSDDLTPDGNVIAVESTGLPIV